jgi:hypothetical protein
MSRTYRNTDLTATITKVEYTNDRIGYLNTCYRVERYMLPHNKVAYANALVEHDRALRVLRKSGLQPSYKELQPPHWSEYTNFDRVKVVYDYDEEVAVASKKYDGFKRDSRFCETGRNTAYKKHCAKDLRHKNKEVLSKILKDDESWEQKPFPDTYMGKQYMWDYW